MPESMRTRGMRWWWNFFPAYRGTGARVEYIAADYREVRIRLPLSWRTRNYVGTIFGGSLYGAVDPIYMIMLIEILGPGYVVWDKAATIRFLRPGRATLRARFLIDEEEIRTIRELLEKAPSVDRVYRVELKDAEGKVHAEVDKTIFVRKRRPPGGSGGPQGPPPSSGRDREIAAGREDEGRPATRSSR